MANRTLIGVGITIMAIIVAGAVVLAGQKNEPTTTHENNTNQQNQNTSSEAVQTTTVGIKDYAYVPAKIQVKKGTAVTWTNQDSIRHDVMPDQESDSFKASELLGKGETYTFTFNEIGTYTYHCSPHPYMKGTVEVIE